MLIKYNFCQGDCFTCICIPFFTSDFACLWILFSLLCFQLSVPKSILCRSCEMSTIWERSSDPPLPVCEALHSYFLNTYLFIFSPLTHRRAYYSIHKYPTSTVNAISSETVGEGKSIMRLLVLIRDYTHSFPNSKRSKG